MLWETNGLSIQPIKDIDTSRHIWCNEAILIEVKNGKGALCWLNGEYDSDYRSPAQLQLNGKPILQAQVPVCPTCEWLLATGYGIENIDCPELKVVSGQINSPYSGLHDAISRLIPILGLLQDGPYVLGDCDLFAADGNGRFFWDVPNELTGSAATAQNLVRIDRELNVVNGFPAFLYPSQGTDRFDASRVGHYRSMSGDRPHFPRAIAYHLGEFCNVLIDGHHKAAACALEGQTVPTILIMPCCGLDYRFEGVNRSVENAVMFAGIDIAVSEFSSAQMQTVRGMFEHDAARKLGSAGFTAFGMIQRAWEPEYAQSAKAYPTVQELSEEIALDMSPIAEIADTDLALWLENESEANAMKLKAAIRRLMRNDRQKAKALALECVRRGLDPELTRTSYETLASFKGDSDVDRVFMDLLVDDNDPHSLLRQIADRYWEQG